MKSLISFFILLGSLNNSLSQNEPSLICDRSVDNIKAMYDRLELFRNLYAFDPEDRTKKLLKYSEYPAGGGNDAIQIEIGDIFYSENYKVINGAYVTMSGSLHFNDIEKYINFDRTDDGIDVTDLNDDNFKFTLLKKPNLGVDIPQSLQEKYRSVADQMDSFHKKLYMVKGIMNRQAPNVTRYMLDELKNGYIVDYEEEGINLFQTSSTNTSGINVTGNYKCGIRFEQGYIVVNGKLELYDEEDED